MGFALVMFDVQLRLTLLSVRSTHYRFAAVLVEATTCTPPHRVVMVVV